MPRIERRASSEAEIEQAKEALLRLTLLGEAVDVLIAPGERLKTFLAQARLADRLYSGIKPHKHASEFAIRMSTLSTLSEKIREATATPRERLEEVLAQIGRVLSESIVGASGIADGPAPIDLSKIDFEALARKFKASTAKNLDIERLKVAIRARLDALIQKNETRVDFREKFEALIEAYNAGSMQIEQLFQELLKLSEGLDAEATRHVREQFSEEELVIFDLLTRPGPELSAKERDTVKKVARDMLPRVRAALRLDWQKTIRGQASVRGAIADALDAGLPDAYDRKLFESKNSALFQHVYERYQQAA